MNQKWHVNYLVSAVNGGPPVSISNIRAPKLHQSTALPCPTRIRISGAIYSIVPQNVWVFWSPWIASLHKPKSVNLTCPARYHYISLHNLSITKNTKKNYKNALPRLSNRIFSGFKSRYMIPCWWRCSSEHTISAR